MQTLKTILHATDLSNLAANAFHAAFALARAHGACLILLYQPVDLRPLASALRRRAKNSAGRVARVT